MTLKQFLRENPGLSDADAAAAFNALPENWQAIKRPQILAWLGAEARLYRLKAKIAEAPPEGQEQLWAAVGNGFEVLILGVQGGDPAVQLEADPAHPQRQMADAAMMIGWLSADDHAALLSYGRLTAYETDETVAQARLDIVAEDEQAAKDAAVAAAQASLSDSIEQLDRKISASRNAVVAPWEAAVTSYDGTGDAPVQSLPESLTL